MNYTTQEALTMVLNMLEYLDDLYAMRKELTTLRRTLSSSKAYSLTDKQQHELAILHRSVTRKELV